jgi:hypothetical protein
VSLISTVILAIMFGKVAGRAGPSSVINAVLLKKKMSAHEGAATFVSVVHGVTSAKHYHPILIFRSISVSSRTHTIYVAAVKFVMNAAPVVLAVRAMVNVLFVQEALIPDPLNLAQRGRPKTFLP